MGGCGWADVGRRDKRVGGPNEWGREDEGVRCGKWDDLRMSVGHVRRWWAEKGPLKRGSYSGSVSLPVCLPVRTRPCVDSPEGGRAEGPPSGIGQTQKMMDRRAGSPRRVGVGCRDLGHGTGRRGKEGRNLTSTRNISKMKRVVT